jgi:AraC family cel operon transcriptional repressor
MPTIKLYSSLYLNYPGYEVVSYITNKSQHRIRHCHDYYEIFLVDRGEADHKINGLKQSISTGFLCFIRPQDEHYYDNISDDFRIINIIVPENIISSLFAYLGEAYKKERLHCSPLAPSANLDFTELTDLIRELEKLILYKKIVNDSFEAVYRITIFYMMVTYFPVNTLIRTTGQMPQWLRLLSLEMLKKENFTKGLPTLYKLSGKSQEHLARSCRRYLNTTPSRLVNDIRLEHSAKLLATTNTPIIEISEDCGFESLSYFYHRFKEHYRLSPREFRRKDKESQVYLMGDLSVKAEIPGAVPLDAGRQGRKTTGPYIPMRL